MDRRDLLRQAIQAASDLRDSVGFDQFAPADPFAAAEKLGVKVVFLGASMEGIYFKGAPGRIMLSALRPVPRRAFTCAHELGHHWFGHGSTIDQLKEDERDDSTKPDEILANGVAAHFLMPSVGIRGAFAKRRWNISAPTPVQVFTIACEFGVGYLTLVNHLSLSLREIHTRHRDELEKWNPQRIRKSLVGDDYDSLVIVDANSAAKTFDVEKGGAILLPHDFHPDGKAVEHLQTLGEFDLYRAARRGISPIDGSKHESAIRVMPKEYEGPAHRRFLEDPDED